MKNNRKILYPLAALLLSIVLAACAGTRNIESFSIVAHDPDSGELQEGVLTLGVGETFQLAGRVHFDNQTTDSVIGTLVTWSSDNEEYVTVDANGYVTAQDNNVILPEGATITGEYRGESDTITVFVEPAIAD